MENGASSILGKLHSSYIFQEIMFIPDPPSTMDGIGLQFLWVTSRVTLDVSPFQLARAMLCLYAPMKPHSTSSWGGFLSLATQATRSSLRFGMHSSNMLRGVWMLDPSTSRNHYNIFGVFRHFYT